ncbi:hypothetical protein P7K49_035339 [Saguinus oedipus]|uniref:Kinesin motor domain-containing protein n=1 Tax=Saguinus oedipus TaxID=9490 RepID=A0ABQ9TMK2_SAGOE|nr:hypothetical protein P7K49_035339 [Saguinus oedipus]
MDLGKTQEHCLCYVRTLATRDLSPEDRPSGSDKFTSKFPKELHEEQMMSGGRSRLHLIDLGSCVKALSKNRDGGSGLCLSLSALGNVILALVNGSKHIPYK